MRESADEKARARERGSGREGVSVCPVCMLLPAILFLAILFLAILFLTVSAYMMHALLCALTRDRGGCSTGGQQ